MNESNVGPLTIRGLVVKALPDSSLQKRVETLESALEGLVVELVEHGSLPPDPPAERVPECSCPYPDPRPEDIHRGCPIHGERVPVPITDEIKALREALNAALAYLSAEDNPQARKICQDAALALDYAALNGGER